MLPAKTRSGRECSREAPCPACGRTRYCVVFEDGGCNCYFAESGMAKVDRSGSTYWVHPGAQLADGEQSRKWEPVPVVRPAPRAVLDRAYRLWLSELSLSPAHRQHLLTERGLTPDPMDAHGFRTAPSWDLAKLLARKLADAFPHDWQAIPGLFLDRYGRPLVTPSAPGVVIPCRAPDGAIIGMQLRLDEPKPGGGKYLGYSSGKRGGASSGNPPSWWAGRNGTGTIRLCEGAFTGALLAQHTGDPVIAASGVGNLASARVLLWLRKLKPQAVVLHPDPDCHTNRHVRSRTAQAIERLQSERRFALYVEEFQ